MLVSEAVPARYVSRLNFSELRPCQEKSIKAGVMLGKSVLVCTPTASGKTFVAELAAMSAIESRQKVIYLVPLVALGMEKFNDLKRRYDGLFKVALSVGDFDSADSFLIDYDLIVCTAEKLDSLIRHNTSWLKYVGCVVVDEIHLLNDTSRGPTLEVLITLLRSLLSRLQIVGLSATIGNPDELAEWLGAELVVDDWRPVPLRKGVYLNGELSFDDERHPY